MEIELILDHLENNQAIFKTKDNKFILWPKDKLFSLKIKKGDVFYFSISKIKQKKAKEILNEILS